MTDIRPASPGTAARPATGSLVRWGWIGLISEVVAVCTWLAAGAWQGSDYSPVHHDISDMGALTAPHAWAYLIPQALAGAGSIAFILFGLRPSLAYDGRAGRSGPWLAALSGVQDLTDAAFRLDCRAADGCGQARATASWHAQLHSAIGFACVLVLIVTPFVLARRFRRLPQWRRFTVPSVLLGIVFIIGLIAVLAPQTAAYQGLSQRTLAIGGAIWGIAVAAHVVRLGRDGNRR
ncbi:hypothetical protein GCM10029978_059300 [Actinoallomurus acanthiterrae]